MQSHSPGDTAKQTGAPGRMESYELCANRKMQFLSPGAAAKQTGAPGRMESYELCAISP